MNNFSLIILITLLLGCSPRKQMDKKAYLQELKKEQARLQEEIMKLEKELTSEDNEKAKIKIVGISTLQQNVFQHFIEIEGKVDGDENINISPKIAGVVNKVLVSAGDVVGKDQLLTILDDQILRQGVEEVKTSLEFAKTMYAKQKNLWENKIGTEVQYLSAKNNVESLEKKLATFNEQLEMTKIKSPIAGTVDEVNIKVGESVMPGMRCFRVVNFSNLKIKAEIGEGYVDKINKNDDVIVYFPDINKEVNSKVAYSGKVIDPINRTFNIEVKLSSGEMEYYPNMIAILKIIDYQADSAVIIPVNTIQQSQEEKFVFVAVPAKNGFVAKKQTIVTGITYNGQVEVIKGLKEGDRLITLGFHDLNNGDLVSPQQSVN